MKKIISLITFITLVSLGVYALATLVGPTATSPTTEPAPAPPELTAPLPETRIIAIGDSLTAGYGLTLAESYPAELERVLRADAFSVSVINAGISGETTAGLLERIPFILSQKPDIVLITIGGNDALRSLPLKQTQENITTIVQSLKTAIPPKQIVLLQIQAPLNMGLAYSRAFTDLYAATAASEGITLLPFVTPEVFLDRTLMQNDGVHPNARGYTTIVESYLRAPLQALLR